MPKVTRKCFRPSCRVRFVPRRRDQKYHDDACRNAHWRELHPRVQIYVTGGLPDRTRVVLHEQVRPRRR